MSEDHPAVRFQDAIRIMPRLPLILGAILLWVPVQLGTAALSVLGPVIAQDRFGRVEQWGVLATGLAAGGLIGAMLSSRISGDRRGLLVVLLAGVSMAGQLVSLAFAPNVVVVTAVFFLGALAAAMAGVTFDTLVQLSVPPDMLSRVGAFEQTLTTAVVPVGIVVALPLAKLLGDATYLITLAALVAAAVAGVLTWVGSRGSLRDSYIGEPPRVIQDHV